MEDAGLGRVKIIQSVSSSLARYPILLTQAYEPGYCGLISLQLFLQSYHNDCKLQEETMFWQRLN